MGDWKIRNDVTYYQKNMPWVLGEPEEINPYYAAGG